MATIKLKGGLFSHPPDVAAMISKREEKYFVAPQDAKGHVKVNGADISAQHELNEGDVVSVIYDPQAQNRVLEIYVH